MAVTDRLFGLTLLLVGLAVFFYYTTWVFVTPFLDAKHPLQALFLDRQFALLIPAALLVLVLTVAGGLVGFVMMGKKKKN